MSLILTGRCVKQTAVNLTSKLSFFFSLTDVLEISSALTTLWNTKDSERSKQCSRLKELTVCSGRDKLMAEITIVASKWTLLSASPRCSGDNPRGCEPPAQRTCSFKPPDRPLPQSLQTYQFYKSLRKGVGPLPSRLSP